jgi:RNA polymerase sigma factor (sigma-70 family)
MAQDRSPLTLEQLEKAAACLRPEEREVLELSARERLSSRAIATRLGISPAAAERILANAICKLAAAIDRQERRARRRRWWRFRS